MPSLFRPFATATLRLCLWSPTSVRLQAALLGRFASATATPPGSAGRTERILVVKLDRIGDFVLLTPFLRELRASAPAAWISLLTTPVLAPLARRCPHLDEVLVAPPPAPGLRAMVAHWWAGVKLGRTVLRPRRFTLGLLPRWDIDLYQAGALLALSGAARRVGFSTTVDPEKHRRSAGADRLLTEAITGVGPAHAVEHNLALLRQLGRTALRDDLELWPAGTGPEILHRVLPGARPGRWVALCPFSSERVKNWPWSNFLAVARAFAGQSDVGFLLLGGPEDAFAGASPELADLPAVHFLAGKLTLVESMEVLAICAAVVTVDTGLMHIGAALHRPLIVLHQTSSEANPASHYSVSRFGPRSSYCTLIRPAPGTLTPYPIDAIPSSAVVAALSDLLARP